MEENEEVTLPKGQVVAESVAIAEVMEYVNKFKYKPVVEESDLMKDFSDVVYAVQIGALTFKDEVPTFTLTEPLRAVDNSVYREKITFKTRIKASEQERISRGMDLKNQMMLYIQKSQAHLIGEPVAMLDKFNRLDLKVIEQLTGLFM